MSINFSSGVVAIPVWVGTTPTISDTIVDESTGEGVNLNGTTVQLVVANPAGVQTAYTATPGNQGTDPGSVSIVCPIAVSANPSYWLAWWRVTAGAVVEETGAFGINVTTHAAAEPVLVGPCSPWISGAEVLAFCDDITDATLAAQAAAWASDVMFAVTARQFRGICADTIRPTRIGCSCWAGQSVGGGVPFQWGFWAANPIFPGWGYVDVPYPEGCGWLSEYALGYPVSQVLQVKVGGSVIDPALYRVDNNRMLIRLPDPTTGQNPGWPVCQNMALDDSQPGTWSVAYTFGVSPPQLAKDAAKQLACQLGISATGGACTLPVGATKVTRQGVTIDRGLLADWSNGASTGLSLVDAAVRAYNPSGLVQMAQVWSPDLPAFGRHVGP